MGAELARDLSAWLGGLALPRSMEAGGAGRAAGLFQTRTDGLRHAGGRASSGPQVCLGSGQGRAARHLLRLTRVRGALQEVGTGQGEPRADTEPLPPSLFALQGPLHGLSASVGPLIFAPRQFWGSASTQTDLPRSQGSRAQEGLPVSIQVLKRVNVIGCAGPGGHLGPNGSAQGRPSPGRQVPWPGPPCLQGCSWAACLEGSSCDGEDSSQFQSPQSCQGPSPFPWVWRLQGVYLQDPGG